MCGICGQYRMDGVDADELQQMADAIAHRGPDDEGFYVNGRIGLGSRRLSIIDLDTGKMPISNEDGTIWIVYNGEIYNFPSLKQFLEDRGHNFKTDTDTEVIVHLYEEFGEQCVEKLSGMFAFAVWDENRQRLFIARDRIGQKPLYYAHNGRDISFASEIKALLTNGRIRRQIDYESLHHYLSLRFIPSPRTMLEDVRKLPPAHYLIFQDGQVQIKRYWQLSFQNKLDLVEDEYIDQLGQILSKTVNSHMISDVPVGAFLSGGMDSSMVVALMARHMSEPFNTFAVGVVEQDFNELPFAKLVADQYQTCHIEKCVESNLIQLLPQIVRHMDEPSDPIAACMYHAAHLAAQYVKVVLGGDGGDELFAGFDRYLGIGYIQHYAMIPSLIRHKLIGPLIDVVPESYTYKSVTQKLRWMHQLSLLPNQGQRYAEATCFFRFNHQEKQLLYNGVLGRDFRSLNSADVITYQFDHAPANNPLDRMLYADFLTRLPEHSLMLTDRMTMAHGLESRSPFLDHQLVEFMAAFPANMKIRGKTLKYALRKLSEAYLPERIVNREKQGFMFPIAYWFQNELYPLIRGFLLNSGFVESGIFNKSYVNRLIEEHRNNKVDHHVRLWMLLNLEIWRRMYIEQEDVIHIQDDIRQHLFSKTSQAASL